MQYFEPLVRPNLDFELLVKAVLKFRSFDLYLEVHAPGLLLAVSAFVIAHRVEQVHVGIHVALAEHALAHIRLQATHLVWLHTHI